MKTCGEMAREWGITARTVTDLCKEGKIHGAVKNGKRWEIPDNAEKPADKRVKTGAYRKKKKPLPVGVSDYVRAQAEYYYVDKTMLIKELLDKKPLVSLFTRPRRFGKTLNMDMLKVFFEKTEDNTGIYFQDKKIWRYGEEYRRHQGKYPVIFLTFKDVKFASWEGTLEKIRALLQAEFARHSELLESDRAAVYEKEFFRKIVYKEATKVEMSMSLEVLSSMLYKHYEIAPIIIIDEYDTPIQEGYSRDFYDEIIEFMRNFFSGAFKDNRYISFGFLTGILRIAHESIFSGLNNLTVNTVLDKEYDSFFGFTHEEVKNMLEYYDAGNKEEEVKEWYDGYRFGDTDVYNPWSVINYISRDCEPQAYWVNTGKNEILGEVLTGSTDNISGQLYTLLNGEKAIARVNQNVPYRALAEEPGNIYSLLLVTGYLKTENKKITTDGTWLCEVVIPNREIACVYKSEVLSHLMKVGAITGSTANKIAESLYIKDFNMLESTIKDFLNKSVSFYDAGAEGFYHGMMLGLIAMMEEDYIIKSNREAGYGRFDICMIPVDRNNPGFIMEFKWKSNLDEKTLQEQAKKALWQIEQKEYHMELKEAGINKIIKLGIAFSGKKVRIAQ